MPDDYEALHPIMDRCGVARVSPRDFCWAVNVAYHEAEAPIYDNLHAEMFTWLAPMWRRLTAPLKNSPQATVRWLDVGCGTGLVGTYISRLLGSRIREAVLLDPSPSMLAQCKTPSRMWPFESRLVAGTTSCLAQDGKFDVVTVNSVLHHIIDLQEFLSALARAVREEGYLLICHEPRGESRADPVFDARHNLYQRLNNRLLMSRFAARASRLLRTASRFAYRRASMQRKSVDHLHTFLADATNSQLRTHGLIVHPMNIREIWSVTDYHVPDQPGGFGRGLTLDLLKKALHPLVLEDYFTYGFWDSHRPAFPIARILEHWLFKVSDGHGALFGARWRKLSRPHPAG